MIFPIFPKRKAEAISNGIFLILLGILIHTGQWWPGIIFALGLCYALRQYLTGRRFNFLLTVAIIGIFGFLTLTTALFSSLFPLLFIFSGFYLVAKETLKLKILNKNTDSEDIK